VLGNAHFGCADLGEAITAVHAIEDGNDHTWVAAWQSLADRICAIADDALAAGHRMSARDAYLRAATYYAAAMVGVDALDDAAAVLKVLFAAHRRCFDTHISLLAIPGEPLAIPYEDTTLPGYFFVPDTDGAARPTLILVNGSDGPISSLYAQMVKPALDRGYNALVFDGPGQQSMLFDRGVPFRPDWEHVITPVVDHILTRSDVDADRLAIYGISQGGYWVPRAMAFEHRLAAAIADPGVVDVSTSWRANLPAELLAVFDAGDKENFEKFLAVGLADNPKLRQTLEWRSKPYGHPGSYDTLKAVEDYHLGDTIAQITTPMLVTDPEGESFWPGQSQRLFDTLPGTKAHVHFTAAEGADLHCQPMARGLTAQRLFDWLDDTLAAHA